MSHRPFFILTRSIEDNRALATKFRAARLRTLSLPTTITSRLPLSRRAEKIFATLNTFDAIGFTSKNAVSYFLKECRKRRVRIPATITCIAVGRKTGETLRAHGITRILVAPEASATSLMALIRKKRFKNILLPRSAIAERGAFVQKSRARVRITPLILYTTLPRVIPQKEMRTLKKKPIAGIVFGSPSGVRGFIRATGKAYLSLPTIALGNTTKAYLRKQGFTSVSAAAEPTPDAIVAKCITLT